MLGCRTQQSPVELLGRRRSARHGGDEQGSGERSPEQAHVKADDFQVTSRKRAVRKPQALEARTRRVLDRFRRGDP